MTSTSARSMGISSTHIVHRGDCAIGPFMLTLCKLAEPVSIRPPQSPQLKPFTFFTGRVCDRQGGDQLYLHMGFFETLAYAERWARAVRGRHPEAIATLAPPALLQLADSGGAGWRSADPEGSPDERHPTAFDPRSLTDTQVLDILQTRHPAPAQTDGEQIELLRPDDTGTRRALKEAVIRGAPVSFAVQLHWSAWPIDADQMPSLMLLKSHTVYVVESRRATRSCFFLRLGFFADPASAKEVASGLRATFASAAVVPVLEEEIRRAQEACAETSLIPCLVQQRPEEMPESSGWTTASRGQDSTYRSPSQGAETLEQTLAQLAERELWSDPDTLSDTGVRHLKVEVQKRTTGRH